MNRHICRAKDIYSGEWVYGYYVQCDGEINHGRAFIIPEVTGIYYIPDKTSLDGFIEVFPDTVCQCTGVKDNNGNMIFEHDIIEHYLYGVDTINEVVYRDGGFCLGTHPIRMFWLKVIRGNKFDNAELMEEYNYVY